MQAVVLVDHGSRAPAANAQLEAVAQALRARLPAHFVAHAHLEIAPPNFASAVRACAAAGAREVVVAPWFLAPGRHGARDMQRLLTEARAAHPALTIKLANPLGVHEGVLDALLTRIAEARKE